jgi:hypothetical protein
MQKRPGGERPTAEILSEADRVLADLERRVEAAKREKRRMKRLRKSIIKPTQEEPP